MLRVFLSYKTGKNRVEKTGNYIHYASVGDVTTYIEQSPFFVTVIGEIFNSQSSVSQQYSTDDNDNKQQQDFSI